MVSMESSPRSLRSSPLCRARSGSANGRCGRKTSSYLASQPVVWPASEFIAIAAPFGLRGNCAARVCSYAESRPQLGSETLTRVIAGELGAPGREVRVPGQLVGLDQG